MQYTFYVMDWKQKCRLYSEVFEVHLKFSVGYELGENYLPADHHFNINNLV